MDLVKELSPTCPLNSHLSLLFVADGRHGIVRVDRVPLACKLVDLPCMIESLKTVDKKTFYKTADVCQVSKRLEINNFYSFPLFCWFKIKVHFGF